MSASLPTIDVIHRRDAAPPEKIVEPNSTTSPENPAGLPAPMRRFVFLDGLRGLACLRIVGVHFFNEPSFHATLATICPKPLALVLTQGWFSVQVFFVLSGFVIAYTLRDVIVTARYFGNFILRRSVRLDPPYWVALGLAIGLAAAGNVIDRSRRVPVPGARALLANMFYLHKIMDWLAYKGWANTAVENIIPPSWTLCFEVQFYLVLMVMIVIAQRLPLKNKSWAGWQSCSYAIVFIPLAMLSLYLGAIEVIVPKRVPLFPVYWYTFFLGVLLWWSFEGKVSARWFWAYVVGASIGFAWRHNPEMASAALAAMMIYAVGRMNHLNDWLNWRWLQFFSRISYSLYLIHVPVGERFLRLGARLGHGPIVAVGCTVGSFALSVAAALILNRLVERPCISLGKRLRKLDRRAQLAI